MDKILMNYIGIITISSFGLFNFHVLTTHFFSKLKKKVLKVIIIFHKKTTTATTTTPTK